METLEALPHIVRSARAIIGKDKPYRIGPSTIGMRHNPYGSRVMENPENRRITMTDRDPRQTSLFAAAWMIGYAAATAEADLQSLTVSSLTAQLGLARVADSGKLEVYPAFHAARALAEMGGNPSPPVSLQPPELYRCGGRRGSGGRAHRFARKPHGQKARGCG